MLFEFPLTLVPLRLFERTPVVLFPLTASLRLVLLPEPLTALLLRLVLFALSRTALLLRLVVFVLPRTALLLRLVVFALPLTLLFLLDAPALFLTLPLLRVFMRSRSLLLLTLLAELLGLRLANERSGLAREKSLRLTPL